MFALRAEFVNLAIILDVFSCKIADSALDTPLATRLPLEALHQAINAEFYSQSRFESVAHMRATGAILRFHFRAMT